MLKKMVLESGADKPRGRYTWSSLPENATAAPFDSSSSWVHAILRERRSHPEKEKRERQSVKDLAPLLTDRDIDITKTNQLIGNIRAAHWAKDKSRLSRWNEVGEKEQRRGRGAAEGLAGPQTSFCFDHVLAVASSIRSLRYRPCSCIGILRGRLPLCVERTCVLSALLPLDNMRSI